MAQGDGNAKETAGLLDLGVKLGYLTPDQVESVGSLQRQMRRAGISLPIGQTLLERKYITLEQLKKLRGELAQHAAAAPAAPAAAAAPAKTAKFGQYEILKTLSEKDRARVFKARDTMMNRVVVLKVLPRSMMSDPQWSERFRREIQLAGKLVHPNIATVFGAGEVDGNPLMTIEFIEGMSLGERLEREGNLPEKVAWRIAKEVAKGLAFANQNGVMHRDIKPDNILCGDDGKVKLIDLGLSKAQGDTSGLTLDGTTVGTPFYISPEQTRGTKQLDSRSDLYSLGCTVFHMLTGSVPFFAEEFTEVMFKQTQAPRPDAREILPEISEASAKLVKRMMAINPDERPANFEQLIEEIEAVLETLPEPVADIRPVAQVATSDLTNRRDQFWVPPAPPASAAGTRPDALPTETIKVKTGAYTPSPKASAFENTAAKPPPRSLFGRIGAWFANLLK